MTEAQKKVGEDVAKMDLYGLLGVEIDATEKAILKAYRKKALKCHPDKNPDNPGAVEVFHNLSKALEILTDKAARAVYDKVIKARLAAQLRNRELDSKRRKLKDDLEARERNAGAGLVNEKTASKNLQAEIDRLRKEGSRLLHDEQERLKQKLKEAQESDSEDEIHPARLKIKWKSSKEDKSNGGYNKENLLKILTKYGDVNALLISTKKSGSAVVEFEAGLGGQLAYENETGLTDNPLTFSWISGQPKPSDLLASKSAKAILDFPKKATAGNTQNFNASSMVSGFSFDSNDSLKGKSGATSESGHHQTGSGETDFESLVFMRMRQAEERKRLADHNVEEENGVENSVTNKND